MNLNQLIFLTEDTSTNILFLKTIEEYFASNRNILDFSITAGLLVIFSVFISAHVQRFWVIMIYIILDFLFLGASVLELPTLQILSISCILAASIIILVINPGVLRKYVAKPLKAVKSQSGEKKEEYDKEKLIQDICTAVNWLSNNKVGALITFERDTPLDDFMKSGTIINCPVTPEIIETIFYEGTRLHDGAIIIKGDTIVAAAVYYPPSTKPIVGKFGARHRAALGISEVTDAITIVVSEETGRISITHAGIIDNVKNDEFETIFRKTIV